MESYKVIHPHISEFPEPMNLNVGDTVKVSERYEGDENWPDWYMCYPEKHKAGYIPGQILDRHADGTATLLEDYDNTELNVVEGELLQGSRQLNAWLWATKSSDGASGWVPLNCVVRSDIV